MPADLDIGNTIVFEQDKIPVTAEAYNIVKDQIVTLKLLPGQLLMVQQLSKEYGISRTPVREALVRLKEEGLVNETDGRKFQVSYITWKLIRDIFQARESVEITAISHAAATYHKKMEKRLSAIQKKLQKSYENKQYVTYFEADNAFHYWLLEVLGNTVIINWMERIRDQQQRIRYATMGISTSMEISYDEHLRMMEAVRRNDVELAKTEMHNHLERALQDILKMKEQANPYLVSFIKE